MDLTRLNKHRGSRTWTQFAADLDAENQTLREQAGVGESAQPDQSSQQPEASETSDPGLVAQIAARVGQAVAAALSKPFKKGEQ